MNRPTNYQKLLKKSSPTQYTENVTMRTVNVMYRIMQSNKSVRSRAAFAARINTNPARLVAWENLTGAPTVENICDICTEFMVSPDWLLMGNGTMFGSAEITTRIEQLEGRVGEIEKMAGIIRETGKKKAKT